MIALITALTMCAFAANSLLCRGALAPEHIDPFAFTAIRVASGALVLTAIATVAGRRDEKAGTEQNGSWGSGAALLAYALFFSLAYTRLDAATGALILFGLVQLTMITGGLIRGERPDARRWLGFVLAIGGLVYLLVPGLTAPDPLGAASMSVAGIGWGVYSLRGRGSKRPLLATAANFRYATPMALAAPLIGASSLHADAPGVALAVASGAVASGLGYALWYRALRGLQATTAAVVQLSVPVIAAAGGVLLLAEPLTARLAISSVVILGGIALAVTAKRESATAEIRKS